MHGFHKIIHFLQIAFAGDKIDIKPLINFNPFESTKSIVTTEIRIESLNKEKPEVLDGIDLADDFDFEDKSTHINNQESSMRTFRSKVIYVPKGHVWLEGDNSDDSLDSRVYGPVPMGLIQSRVFARVWPLNEMRLL